MVTVAQACTKFGITRMMLNYWVRQSVLKISGKDGNRNLYNEAEIPDAIQWSSNRRSARATHASHSKQRKRNPEYSGPPPPKVKATRVKTKRVRIRVRESVAATPRTQVIKFVPKDSMPGWARDMRDLARSFRR